MISYLRFKSMNEKRCYTHNKPNCESQYCDVETGKCIRKTKAGRPYKTKLDTKLGSTYYYDERYGLVGTKDSVNAYIKEIKSGKKETKVAKISKKPKKISPPKVTKKKISHPKVTKKEISPPKVESTKLKKISPKAVGSEKGDTIPTAKTMKLIQDRIDNIMNGEELSREFLNSKSKAKKSIKKTNISQKSFGEKSVSKTLRKTPETILLPEKKLRDYKSVIGLIDGECYG